MPIIKARANRVRTVRHICRLQEPSRDALVLYARFIGDTADGAWTLVVSDRAGQDTGTLVSWCLKLRGAPDLTSGVGGTPTLPQVAQLMQSRPNPVPERGTSIQFALPNSTSMRSVPAETSVAWV